MRDNQYVQQYSTKCRIITGLYTTLTGLLLIANVTVAHEVNMVPCECAGETYHLWLEDGGEDGTFTKTPDKPEYVKGELVVVTYTPASDRVFINWSADPPSNLASGSRELSTAIIMTGDTELFAHTAPDKHTLRVTGTGLVVPSGATLHGYPDFGFSMLVPHKDEVHLTAIPEGDYQIAWKNRPPPYHLDHVIQYSNSVSVRVNNDLHIHADYSRPPLLEWFTGTAIVEGGSAEIYTAGAQPWSGSGGIPFTAASQSTPYEFVARCKPDPGYHLVCWTWEDGIGMHYYPPFQIPPTELYADMTFTANVTPGIRLAVLTEGQGVVISDDFQESWNPWPMFYSGPVNEYAPQWNNFANEVNIEYRACPGWVFDHWKVLREDAEWETVLDDNGNPFRSQYQIFMNWYESEPGQRRVPTGMSVYYLKAVFEKRKYLGVHSDTEPDVDPSVSHGHGWITVWNGNSVESFGLYPSVPGQPWSDVARNIDLDRTPVASRYYLLSDNEYSLLMSFIESTGDVYDNFWFQVNCTSWAAQAAYIAGQEELEVLDTFYYIYDVPLPRKLARSIRELEQLQPTSLSCPK